MLSLADDVGQCQDMLDVQPTQPDDNQKRLHISSITLHQISTMKVQIGLKRTRSTVFRYIRRISTTRCLAEQPNSRAFLHPKAGKLSHKSNEADSFTDDLGEFYISTYLRSRRDVAEATWLAWTQNPEHQNHHPFYLRQLLNGNINRDMRRKLVFERTSPGKRMIQKELVNKSNHQSHLKNLDDESWNVIACMIMIAALVAWWNGTYGKPQDPNFSTIAGVDA